MKNQLKKQCICAQLILWCAVQNKVELFSECHEWTRALKSPFSKYFLTSKCLLHKVFISLFRIKLRFEKFKDSKFCGGSQLLRSFKGYFSRKYGILKTELSLKQIKKSYIYIILSFLSFSLPFFLVQGVIFLHSNLHSFLAAMLNFCVGAKILCDKSSVTHILPQETQTTSCALSTSYVLVFFFEVMLVLLLIKVSVCFSL